jgi:predicted ester cyclase
MSSDSEALVRRWFEEVWNQGREAAIDEMLAGHSVVHGLGGDLDGPAGFKQFQRAYRSASPDMHLHLDAIVSNGDTVAARWSGTGTHRGPGLGFEATGRHVQFTGMTFIRVEEGRFVEGWNSMDQLGLLQQLGVVNLPAVAVDAGSV